MNLVYSIQLPMEYGSKHKKEVKRQKGEGES